MVSLYTSLFIDVLFKEEVMTYQWLLFIVISGRMVSDSSHQINSSTFFFLFRLTPPFAVVLLIQGTLFRYFGDGPIWNVVADEIESDCSATWWKSLLYVQNYMTPISPV